MAKGEGFVAIDTTDLLTEILQEGKRTADAISQLARSLSAPGAAGGGLSGGAAGGGAAAGPGGAAAASAATTAAGGGNAVLAASLFAGRAIKAQAIGLAAGAAAPFLAGVGAGLGRALGGGETSAQGFQRGVASLAANVPVLGRGSARAVDIEGRALGGLQSLVEGAARAGEPLSNEQVRSLLSASTAREERVQVARDQLAEEANRQFPGLLERSKGIEQERVVAAMDRLVTAIESILGGRKAY